MSTPIEILTTAARLITDDDSNPEYDRAIVELVSDLCGLSTDDRDATLTTLRTLAEINA